jgi:hypothetical protein
MSDTPETNARLSNIVGFYSCATVPADFARQLERHRDTAREKYCEVLTDNMLHVSTIARLERERDEAIAARKASAADWLGQVEQANARMARALQQVALVERERDDAREYVDRYRERLDLTPMSWEAAK